MWGATAYRYLFYVRSKKYLFYVRSTCSPAYLFYVGSTFLCKKYPCFCSKRGATTYLFNVMSIGYLFYLRSNYISVLSEKHLHTSSTVCEEHLHICSLWGTTGNCSTVCKEHLQFCSMWGATGIISYEEHLQCPAYWYLFYARSTCCPPYLFYVGSNCFLYVRSTYICVLYEEHLHICSA